MTNNSLEIFSFSDLIKSKESIIFDDEDIVITSGFLKSLPEAFRMNFLAVISCKEGFIEFNVNGKHNRMQAGEHFLYLPGLIINDWVQSSNSNVIELCMTTGFISNLIPTNKNNGWKFIKYLKEEIPIRNFNDLGKYKGKFQLYSDLICEQFINKGPFHKMIIRHLFSALIIDLADIYQSDHKQEDLDYSFNYSAPEHLFNRFNHLIREDNGKHRDVAYFADKLCYTAKYVSNVSKRISGLTASELINIHVAQLIKFQLLHSDKTIKEIAGEFDFPNLSFFGRYVKKHLGLAPKIYRQNKKSTSN